MSFRAAVSAVLMAGVIVGCEGGTTTSTWGQEAERYDDALVGLMNEQGPVAWLPFVSDDLVFDQRSILHSAARYDGLDEATLHAPFFRFGAGELEWTSDQPVFIDERGYAAIGSMRFDVSFVLEETGEYAIVRPEIDAGRIEAEVHLMLAERWRLDPWRDPAVADAAEALAARWARAWSDTGPDTVEPLYGPMAVLEDSIAGIEVRGAEAITTRHGLAPETTWTIASVGGSNALYPVSTATDAFSGVVFVARGDDGQGCPGRQLVWLTVDEDGLIDHERRFWAVDDARPCLPRDAVPRGWWTGLPPPEAALPPYEDLETTTGTVIVADQATAIRNGTPTLQSLTEWALARFDRAGMELPTVDTITFTRFSDYCTDARGRAIPGLGPETTWHIVLCFDEGLVCRRPACEVYEIAAKRAILHELAHVWMAEQLTDTVRDTFTAYRGLDDWDDRDAAWGDRAVEFITWGLLDTPFALLELGRPPTETRVEAFQLLTGRAPLQPIPQ